MVARIGRNPRAESQPRPGGAAPATVSPTRTGKTPALDALRARSTAASGFDAPRRKAGFVTDPPAPPRSSGITIGTPPPPGATSQPVQVRGFSSSELTGERRLSFSVIAPQNAELFAVATPDPVTHELNVVLQSYLPAGATPEEPATVAVPLAWPDDGRAWTVQVKNPSGASLLRLDLRPKPQPDLTAFEAAPPADAIHDALGGLSVYSVGGNSLGISGEETGPLHLSTRTEVDAATGKMVVVVDRWHAPSEPANDRAVRVSATVPLPPPPADSDYDVEVRDTSGTVLAHLNVPNPSPPETALSPKPPAGATLLDAQLYARSSGSAKAQVTLTGSVPGGPAHVFAETRVDEATHEIFVTYQAYRGANEPARNRTQPLAVDVPLGVQSNGEGWAVHLRSPTGDVLGEAVWPDGARWSPPPPPNPASGLADAAASVPERKDGSGKLVVWAREGAVASSGQTVSAGLLGGVVATQDGLYTARVHVSGTTVLDTAEGQQPFASGATVTSDGFDQVNVLWTVNTVLARLKAAGVDLDLLQRSSLANSGVARAEVNGTTDLNAWYTPTENKVQFGTDDGVWHLGSDADVVAHEFGHYALDHLNPNMLGAGEGAAIHEGFGDLMAALTFDDPEIAEDVSTLAPSSQMSEQDLADWKKNGFMREVKNDAKAGDPDMWEPHAKGQVYSGSAWVVRDELVKLVGDSRKADDLMLGVLTRQAALFTSAYALTSEDFVDTLVGGLKEGLSGALPAEQEAALEKVFLDEAIRRGLVPAGYAPKVGVASAAQEALVKALPAGTTEKTLAARLPQALKAAFADGHDANVRYVPVTTQKVGALTKYVFQATVMAPDGPQLPLSDGFFSVVAKNGEIVRAGGGGATVPDGMHLAPLKTSAYDRAVLEGALRRFLSTGGIPSAELRAQALAKADVLFDPATLRTNQVVFQGHRCVSLTTSLGEFLYDPATKTMSATRLAFVR